MLENKTTLSEWAWDASDDVLLLGEDLKVINGIRNPKCFKKKNLTLTCCAMMRVRSISYYRLKEHDYVLLIRFV